VRKCILTPEPQAYLESSNIQHVQRFRHNHIVKLIKVFAHGRSINLIFPKALTNLDHLLRDPSFSYGNKRGARLHTADAWTQLLGVCNALKKMHGYDNESGDPTGRGHTCIHFDLKPDNILVERQTGNWLITDFGQAALTERRRGTTPRVGGHFGTDAYAPPEIDDTSMAFGRAYDIWSLGCIMLEVTAFVVRGYVGLTGTSTFAGLDQVRKSMPAWARNDDERFFCQEAPNGEFVVKKEIVDFMENLRSSQRREDDDPASFSFLSTILGLIDRMLKPKVMDRANISRVGDTLSSALNEACATPNEHREHVVVVANNEVELGGPQVKQIRLWHSSANNDGMELSSLAILENHAGFMRLHCWAQGHEPSNITFRRSDVKMVPLYAFWDPGRLQESRTWIDFLYLSDRSCSEVPSSKYSFDGQAGLRQARMIQSVVTSQDIVDSFGLRRVRLRKPPSTRNVLKGLFRTRKPDRESETMDSNGGLSDLGSATVQIWIERNSDYPAQLQRRVSLVSQASTTTRSIHQYDGDRPGVPPCRVCIYLHRQHFICTIKVDVNWVIQESESDEKVLVFKSLPSGRNRTFCVSWLRPTPEELTAGQHFPAGVPLDPRVLQYYEDSDCTEVENLELTFLNADHRDAFKWKYLVTKKDWNSERERIEDRVEVNRIPGRVPRMPDGINHLPMPEDRVPFGANVDFDRDLQSNSSTSTTRSRHDSTIEHIATSPQSEQNPQFLTIPSPRRW
jgi:serine/threonine protein kinase